MSHVHADVDGGGLLFERREVGGQRQRGAAVLASYNGSDALRDDGERLGMRVEAVVGVGVRVDEAGGEDEAAGVDDAFAARGLEVADGGDAVALDADGRASAGGTGAVDDGGVRDEDAGLRPGVARRSDGDPARMRRPMTSSDMVAREVRRDIRGRSLGGDASIAVAGRLGVPRERRDAARDDHRPSAGRADELPDSPPPLARRE